MPRAVDIAEQLATAMASAHASGIAHRDLKPENVLVTAEGRVVVTDFGIALMAGARRLTWRWLTSAMGTPDYMAPEQVEGKRGDARTDVYALGIMLFEMLAGRVPWEGDNPLVVMSQHVNAPLPSLREIDPHVPAPLEAIVTKCLRKDPDERYADAGELCVDLDSLAGPGRLDVRVRRRRGQAVAAQTGAGCRCSWRGSAPGSCWQACCSSVAVYLLGHHWSVVGGSSGVILPAGADGPPPSALATAPFPTASPAWVTADSGRLLTSR